MKNKLHLALQTSSFFWQRRIYNTWTVANALNVTFLGYSGAGDPLDLITGFNGVLVFDVISPADVANSFSFCDRPTPCCFWIRGDAIEWAVAAGEMYLKVENGLMKIIE